MEDSKLQTSQKQSHRPKNKDRVMKLANKKNNDIWTTHGGTSTRPTQPARNIHVQAHTNNDEPTMER